MLTNPKARSICGIKKKFLLFPLNLVKDIEKFKKRRANHSMVKQKLVNNGPKNPVPQVGKIIFEKT